MKALAPCPTCREDISDNFIDSPFPIRALHLQQFASESALPCPFKCGTELPLPALSSHHADCTGKSPVTCMTSSSCTKSFTSWASLVEHHAECLSAPTLPSAPDSLRSFKFTKNPQVAISGLFETPSGEIWALEQRPSSRSSGGRRYRVAQVGNAAPMTVRFSWSNANLPEVVGGESRLKAARYGESWKDSIAGGRAVLLKDDELRRGGLGGKRAVRKGFRLLVSVGIEEDEEENDEGGEISSSEEEEEGEEEEGEGGAAPNSPWAFLFS